MKRSSTAFLQAIVVLVGIGALAILLLEPRVEGRNAHATNFEIYFKDPFLAYAYFASIPFFVALYQVFKVLGYAGHDKVISPAAVKALGTIKWCALSMIGFIAGAEVFVLMHESDDAAGGVVIGIVLAIGSAIIAAAAATFERVLKNAVDMKSENDLTV